MADQNLELTPGEREKLMELFAENLLRDNYRDYEGKPKVRIMRSPHIDIKDVRFAKRIAESEVIQSLIEKKVIVKDQFWHRIYLKKDFVKAIYNLADQGNWELITQLANTWVDVQED